MYNRTPHITPTPPPPRTNERRNERTNERKPPFIRARARRTRRVFVFISFLVDERFIKNARDVGDWSFHRRPCPSRSLTCVLVVFRPRFGRENLPAPLGRVFDVSTPFSSLFLPFPRGDADERKKREVKTSKTRRVAHTETKRNKTRADSSDERTSARTKREKNARTKEHERKRKEKERM